jgi:hypothetical protein
VKQQQNCVTSTAVSAHYFEIALSWRHSPFLEAHSHNSHFLKPKRPVEAPYLYPFLPTCCNGRLSATVSAKKALSNLKAPYRKDRHLEIEIALLEKIAP